MTEADWPTATDPAAMLTRAADRVSDRKLRLYLVGCCRRRWDLFADDRCRRAVEAAERYADGRATDADLAQALRFARVAAEQARAGRASPDPVAHIPAEVSAAAWGACDRSADLRRLVRAQSDARELTAWAARVPAAVAAAHVLFAAGSFREPVAAAARAAAERAAQADLLRCVFGDPFVYTVPDPAWRTAAALGLAGAIYAERAFDRLPILADALEEAGCGEPDILSHCRRPGEHARGCWVIDLLLDKS